MADISGMAGGMGDDGAATVPFHPRPINVQVDRFECGGVPMTVIARTWTMDDAARCRLCSRCTASAADRRDTVLCLKRVERHVPDDEVMLLPDRSILAAGRAEGRMGGGVT